MSRQANEISTKTTDVLQLTRNQPKMVKKGKRSELVSNVHGCHSELERGKDQIILLRLQNDDMRRIVLINCELLQRKKVPMASPAKQ